MADEEPKEEKPKPKVCCDKPDLTLMWVLGTRTADGRLLLELSKINCKNCGLPYKFYDGPVYLNPDNLSLVMTVEVSGRPQ